MAVQILRQNDFLKIILNRPEALNSLNLIMIEQLHVAIDDLENDDSLKGALLYGAGEKAYCAGGDIKQARQFALDKNYAEAMKFFEREYALNLKMFNCKNPLIALMNGITMGGGVGISAPCATRIATSRTVWAMPEVKIGFFPDVGGAYYLSRIPSGYGLKMGLTGARLHKPEHLLWAGLATHFLSDSDVQEFLKLENNFEELQNFLREKGQGLQAEMPPEIDESYKAEYAPLSYKFAREHIEWARTKTFKEVIARDLELAEIFIKHPDFIEGVRAIVVDKDNKPVWTS